MEMEHLNENTIRVHVGLKDLEARGVDFMNMIGDRREIEDFFYSVLEEVDTAREFADTEMLSFQVIPNANGLEIIISKGEGDPFEHLAERLKSLPNGVHDMNEALNPEAVFKNVEEAENDYLTKVDDFEKNWEDFGTVEEVFVFDSFENIIDLANEETMPEAMSNVYEYNGEYYLVLTYLTSLTTVETFRSDVSLILEYGDRSSLTSAVVSEYGTTLMETNALEQILKIFSN
jgi:adapter protein MecA 1/2